MKEKNFFVYHSLSYVILFLEGGAILIVPIQACCWSSSNLRNLVWTLFPTSLSLHFSTSFSSKMLRAVRIHAVSDFSLQFCLQSTQTRFCLTESFLVEISNGLLLPNSTQLPFLILLDQSVAFDTLASPPSSRTSRTAFLVSSPNTVLFLIPFPHPLQLQGLSA